MTSDKTAGRDLDTVADDEPTAELEVLTEANIAVMEPLHDDLDEPSSASRAELEARMKICELQSEIERLRSDATKLGTETRAFKELRDEIADELEAVSRKNSELTALLSQRDEELAALRSLLAAKDATVEKANGSIEAAAEETRSTVRSEREFDPGETRKLVGHGDFSSQEFELKPGQMSLGSAIDNDIRIKAEFVSGHHVQILNGSKESILRDMNSTNGTYVNSRKIYKCALHDGDSIVIGKLRFTFVVQRNGASASHPVASIPTPQDSQHLDPGSWR
jgi:myosin heavy subunit